MVNREKELQKVVFELINSSNTVFYGLFLTEVNKFFSDRIPTACLAKHPSAKIPVMLFNPDFWDKLNNKQRKFLVLHEISHFINESFLLSDAFGLTDHKLANIAMDMNINSILMNNIPEEEIEFIEGGQLPSSYPNLNLEEEKDTLYYYNRLKQAKDDKDQKGSSGDSNFDEMLDSDDNVDMHPTWEEITEGLSDLEKEALKRDIVNRLEKIAEEVSKQNGTIPSFLEGILKSIQKVKQSVNWKALFRRFIGSTVSSDVLLNRKRPSKRFEDNPSTKYKFKVSGVFLSDSSGSVSDEDLEKCNAELYNVYKSGGNVDYASWDAECETPKKYDGKLQIERTKCGGTDLNCAIHEINKGYRQKGWNFAIITTDGHVPAVTVKSKIPTMILIVDGGNVNFDNPHRYKVVKMN